MTATEPHARYALRLDSLVQPGGHVSLLDVDVSAAGITPQPGISLTHVRRAAARPRRTA